MRILFLAYTLPYPLTWGFGIRVYQFNKLLARRHEVSILAYASTDEILAYANASDAEKIAALSEFCTGVHVVPGDPSVGLSKRFAQFASLLSPSSYQSRYLYSAAMQRTLDALCRDQPFDVIQVESSQLAAVLKFDERSRVVIDQHDIVYELLHRMFHTERSPVRRLYNWSEYRKFKREEIALWRRFSAVVTTSPREVRSRSSGLLRRAAAVGRESLVRGPPFVCAFPARSSTRFLCRCGEDSRSPGS